MLLSFPSNARHGQESARQRSTISQNAVALPLRDELSGMAVIVVAFISTWCGVLSLLHWNEHGTIISFKVEDRHPLQHLRRLGSSFLQARFAGYMLLQCCWYDNFTGYLCCIARLLIRVDMPNNIVRETNNLVAGSFCHFGKTFGLCLILKCVCWEVDS